MKSLLLTDFFAVKTTRSDEQPKSKPSVSKSNPQQTYLNLGQQDFFHSCPACQMTFNPAEPSDAALHRKYHSFCTKGITLAKNSSKYVQIHSTQEYSIVKCQLKDSSVVRKNMQIIQFINIELGCSFLQLEPKKTDCYNAFILLNPTRTIVGYLLAKSIQYAYKYCCNEVEGEFVKLDEKIDAKLGIGIIWIAAAERRKGFGSLLLDVAINDNDAGIRKEDVAFSQPTQAGRCLFTKFLGPKYPMLVYLEA